MSRHLSLIGAALLLTCCNQPQEYQVNIDNVDSTISNAVATNHIAQPKRTPLELCDDGDGPCTPQMYDALCDRGESWACSSVNNEMLNRIDADTRNDIEENR